ncbi:MAG: TAT-variant-translocated molybdopterin oxidoreductase [Verrucomicrobiales bacterium]|nr:TAT-variant-translocated molybdopterin oxidoreductase [Verrucomicrobiales bacterium]
MRKSSPSNGHIGNDSEVQYWRSIGEANDATDHADWSDKEFPEGAMELPEDFSRRDFLKLMGASAGLAGVGMLGVGCRRPVETIIPFGKQPAGYVHGVPQFFATARPTATGAVPLVVKSDEGRPTKVEGNADHPDSNGATDLHTQASILNLYDPDRARQFTKYGKVMKGGRADAISELGDLVNENVPTAFLMPAGNSPSRARMIEKITTKMEANAKFYVHEAVDYAVHQRAATAVFGASVKPFWKLDKAAIILSLDCDFIGTEEDSSRHMRDFARGRKLAKNEGRMSRLYVAEALMGQTGANADHRQRMNASAVTNATGYLADKLGIVVKGTVTEPANKDWLDKCLEDLQAHAGKGLVMAGYRQPQAVHELVNLINEKLGNLGHTVEIHVSDTSPVHGNLHDLKDNLGNLERIINLGCNPAYDGGADLDWAKNAKGLTKFRLSDFAEDESSEKSGVVAPRAHYLESWSDARTSDGTLVPVQPLIAPLFDGLSELEVLSAFAHGIGSSGKQLAKQAHEIVQDTLKLESGDASWGHFLHSGFLADSAGGKKNELPGKSASELLSAEAISETNLEVVFTADHSVGDGTFANNGWCQELPDPITKITWDNVMSISRVTGEELKLSNGQVVKLTLNGRSVEGPIWIQPGMADNTVCLPLGYGKKHGRIANFKGEGVGFNAYTVRDTDFPNIAIGGKLTATGKTHSLSSTQEHWSMEGRSIIREATLAKYKETPNFALEMGIKSHARNEGKIYQHPYKERPGLKSDVHQWGMSVDLGSCTGCSACVIACQSENNIPIVGKEQVGNGREMHWLRIDRYYTGKDHDPSVNATAGDDEQHLETWIDDPQVINQPMMCQHCESAPCETVCPVNATVHDEEGLNTMAYNRCVGTRYCSNNCAWKVRRFNFFDYNKRPLDKLYDSPITKPSLFFDWMKSREKSNRPDDEWDLVKLAKNPDVSVRMRGVMEKCTYCVQRIEGAKIAQKVKAKSGDDVQVPTNGVKTACEQACPAEAITFGNLLNDQDDVVAEKANPRNYEVLGFLDNVPRTTYLAKIRNPNAAMPDAYEKPFSTSEYHPEEEHAEDSEHEGHGKAGH